MNGKFVAVVNGKSETWHFKDNKRVTADGQDYNEYIAQQEVKRREVETRNSS